MTARRLPNLIGETLRLCLFAILALVPVAGGSTPVLQAATLTVTNTNDAGPGSLRQKLIDANNGDTISFAPQVTGVISLTSGELDIVKSLTILGPGAANLALSGNGSRVISVATGVSVTVSGLTVADGAEGYAASGPTSNRGGGIYNSGTLTLINSHVRDNSAVVPDFEGCPLGESYGGGLYNNAGSLTLINSQVYNNLAGAFCYRQNSGSGGGLFNYQGTVTVTNSSIFGNRVGWHGGGGGLYNDGGTLTLTNSQVYSNSYHGGISNAQGIVRLANSQVYDNLSYGAGGGVVNSGALTLSDSQVYGNQSRQVFSYEGFSAGSGTGGGVANFGTLAFVNSQVYGNQVFGGCNQLGQCLASSGGGVWNAGSLELVTSLVRDNQAYSVCNDTGSCAGGIGGGMSNDGVMTVTASAVFSNAAPSGSGGGLASSGLLVLTNATVSGNSASYGGGLWVSAGSTILHNITLANNAGVGITVTVGSTVTVQNSILADNAGDNCAGTLISAGFNLASDATCGLTATGDLPNAIPLFGPIADNGGGTLTHALLAGSPAIDAGNPAPPDSGGNACAATDQRGVLRPQGPRCDIGAFEVTLSQAAFSAALYLIAKDAGASAVTVLLAPVPDLTATVSYATDEGTALAGIDYLTATGTLTFTSGVTAQAFSIPILDNPANTTQRTLTVALSNPSGAMLGPLNSATLLIVPKVFELGFPFVAR